MSMNVTWIAEATIKPGKREEFEAVRNDLVAATSQEEGALNYEWYICEEGKEVYIYERYADFDAAVTHLKTFGAHADRFVAAADFTLLTVLTDRPDDLREHLAGINTAFRVPWGGFKK